MYAVCGEDMREAISLLFSGVYKFITPRRSNILYTFFYMHLMFAETLWLCTYNAHLYVCVCITINAVTIKFKRDL